MVSRFREFERVSMQRGLRHQRQVVVAITANSAEIVAESSLFDLVFAKPIDFNVLAKTIYGLLQQQQQIVGENLV